MKLLNPFKFLSKTKIDTESDDWRRLDALPQEIITEHELNQMQDKVTHELSMIQKESEERISSHHDHKPQALFYFHKYIDSKFNKSNAAINAFFYRKQNIIDQKYAEGLGEVKAEIIEYNQKLAQVHEAELRLQQKLSLIDPTQEINLQPNHKYDDSKLIQEAEELPTHLNWLQYEGEIK